MSSAELHIDVEAVMLQLLATQMEYVRSDREAYGEGMVVVFTSDNRSYLQFPRFDNADEKYAEYAAIVERARGESATLIITVNAARTARGSDKFDPETHQWGDLSPTNSDPCILITASGPGLQTWTLEAVYRLTEDDVVFEPTEFIAGLQVNLLPEWSTDV